MLVLHRCPQVLTSPVRRHIKDHHKQITGSLYHCPRCKEDMLSREALDAHIAVPNDRICSPQEGSASRNPEDGITGRVEDWLNNRKANAKIANWESLWRILFPSDKVVPDQGECFHMITLASLVMYISMQTALLMP